MKKYHEPVEKSLGAPSSKSKNKKKFKIVWRSKRWNRLEDEEECLDPKKEAFWTDWEVVGRYETETQREQALKQFRKGQNHGRWRELFQYKKEEET
jgi:hypothetical protein